MGDEEVVKCLLGFRISSKQKRDADQERLFNNVFVINLLDMLAEELNAANVHKTVLFCLNNFTVLREIITFPVCRRCYDFFVFNFHDLA